MDLRSGAMFPRPGPHLTGSMSFDRTTTPTTPTTTPRRQARATVPLLTIATVTTGLMAGLFFAFDISVMPGLAHTDDRTYAEAMQNFNAAIDGSGLFMLVFSAALVVTALAAVLAHVGGRRPVARWAGAAAALYLMALIITFAVDIPLNDELAAAGDPGRITDFSVVDDFRSTWATTNIARTLLCTAALGVLTRALLLAGAGGRTTRLPG